jgi:CO/xanthine dehydrogenase FAD-binding subunit
MPIPGSEFTAVFDAVVKAIGEKPDTSLLPAALRQKARKAAPSAHLLGKNLFAGGDFITGPSTVIQAVASGREAARLIELSFKAGTPSAKDAEKDQDFKSPSLDTAPRIRIPELPVAERLKSVDVEDQPGLGLSEIETEANRCFNCGCLAVSPSDIGIALTALDANIVTTKRTVDAQQFFTASATESTVLDPDELITEIQIPKPPDRARQNYLKFTLRNPLDFAVVSVASIITVEKGVCTDARIVLGAVAPEPVRATKAEEVLKGRSIDEDRAAEAAKEALAGARTLDRNAYKVEITRALVKRAILG